MSKLDDLYRLHRLLDGRRTGIRRSALIDTHNFARSTLTRLIADLRDKLGAPIICDRKRGGYNDLLAGLSTATLYCICDAKRRCHEKRYVAPFAGG